MTFYIESDIKILTDIITDENGNAIVSGTVNCEIFNLGRTVSLISKRAMSHVDSGIWEVTYDSTSDIIPNIDSGTRFVRISVTVGDPPDATFERIERVLPRLSGNYLLK